MAIKPILFSSPMIRAIKDGKKRMTRRVMKPQPPEFFVSTPINEYWDSIWVDGVGRVKVPYKPNDVLWVRETWQFYNDEHSCYVYAADEENPPAFGWRPSIFMPKEAARIFLRVTNVRVERLQEITVDDVLREGVAGDIKPPPVCRHEPEFPRDLPRDFEKFTQAKKDEWFRSFGTARYIGWCKYADDVFEEWIKLWNSLRNPQNISSYGWDANPWVWVLEFEPWRRPVGF